MCRTSSPSWRYPREPPPVRSRSSTTWCEFRAWSEMTMRIRSQVGGSTRCAIVRAAVPSSSGHSTMEEPAMATQEAAIGVLPEADRGVERFETVIIGGGQAGLSVGYFLKKRGHRFVVLDANERIGGSWRTRTW